MTAHKVLIVDDEPTTGELYKLQLNSEFPIDTAQSGAEGLASLAANGPYAVVIADEHMPEMAGTEFLKRVRESSPNSVRMMLTADSQQKVAVDAVNEGHIFRFLNKPCPSEQLAPAIRSALEQYRLVMSEKELLTKTLVGSIGLLTEILSIVTPVAFGRANRMKALVQEMCDRLNVDNSWEIALAAMLSQVGCVSLPESLLKMVEHGETLLPREFDLYKSYPKLGHDLVSKIPRLERIAGIIALHQHSYTDVMTTREKGEQQDIAKRAAFLKVAHDYDRLIQRGVSPEHALSQMKQRQKVYAHHVMQALEKIVEEKLGHTVREIRLSNLREGMVLAEDITNDEGAVLIAKGNQVTRWLVERLRHQKLMGRPIHEPILVLQTDHRESACETTIFSAAGMI